jgi:hypothetical protein
LVSAWLTSFAIGVVVAVPTTILVTSHTQRLVSRLTGRTPAAGAVRQRDPPVGSLVPRCLFGDVSLAVHQAEPAHQPEMTEPAAIVAAGSLNLADTIRGRPDTAGDTDILLALPLTFF